MNTYEKIFRVVLTIMILACLSLPIVVIYTFETTQWQAFSQTWGFLVYGFILFVVGIGIIEGIWRTDYDN